MSSVTSFDRSDWTVQTLGDFLAQQQACNEERVRGIYERDQVAHKAQMDAVSKRLDVITDLYNRTIENGLRGVSREEFEHNSEAARERLEETMAPINKTLAELGKPNWMLLGGFMSFAIAAMSGCWLLIGLQINVAITPQALSIEAVRTTNASQQAALNSLETRVRASEVAVTQSAASDAESRVDRGRLNQRVGTLEGGFGSHIAEDKANSAQFRAQLVEIETQFCAEDQFISLMRAGDARLFAMLWAKVFAGSVYPTDNSFYPQICNRSAAMSNMVTNASH